MSISYWFGDEDQKGNFSNDNKDTFDPKKRYVGIRLQQGVPLLDRDWNELEDIRRYEEQMLRKWYIGDGIPDDDGFKIMPLDEPGNDFKIKAGRCLVDGLEAVNDHKDGFILYSAQEDGDADLEEISELDEFFVYLDVWIEEVNKDEDDDLANDDDVKMETCVRHKLKWRVRVRSRDMVRKDNHHYYNLASIRRDEITDPIDGDYITDLRITELALNLLSGKLTSNKIADDLHLHSKLVARDGSPDPALSVDPSGNVGIGTSNPQGKLTVSNVSIGEIGFEVSGKVGVSRIPTADGHIILNSNISEEAEIIGGGEGQFIFRAYDGEHNFDRFVIDGKTGNARIYHSSPKDAKGGDVIGLSLLSTDEDSRERGGVICGKDVSQSIFFGVSRDGKTDVNDYHADAYHRFFTTGEIQEQEQRMQIDKRGVTIGKEREGGYLRIIDVPQDGSKGGTLVLGPNKNLRLGYHDDYSWIQSNTDSKKPLAINPVGNNVGIGTTAPSRALHVEGEIHSGGSRGGFSFADMGIEEFVEGPTNGERWVWHSAGGIARLWSGGDKLTIDKDGNLTAEGAIRGTLEGKIRLKDTRDVDTPPIGFNQEVSFDLKKKSAVGLDTDELSGMMTLAPDSTTIPDHQLNFNGDGIFWRKSVSLILAIPVRPGAEIRPSATIRWGSWQQIKTEPVSDERFKAGITPLTHVLDKLDKVRGISFEWNDLYESLGYPSKGGRREIGLIAQEVEAAFPELVTSHGDEKYRVLNYERLTAVLVEAVKELRAEVEALKQKITS